MTKIVEPRIFFVSDDPQQGIMADDWRTRIDDEKRSMIASLVVHARHTCTPTKHVCLCCGGADAIARCAEVVSENDAEDLNTFAYEYLGCIKYTDPGYDDDAEQGYLDHISALGMPDE